MILTDDDIWKNDDIMAANSGYGANFETLRELIRAVESALLEKLRGGVELPEALGDGFTALVIVGDTPSLMEQKRICVSPIAVCSLESAIQYGAAQRPAGREQAIEEWRVHLLELWEKGNFDLKDAIKETYSALAAPPQEQT